MDKESAGWSHPVRVVVSGVVSKCKAVMIFVPQARYWDQLYSTSLLETWTVRLTIV